MALVGVTARPAPQRVKTPAVPVNRDQHIAPGHGTDGCCPGCADIESETE